MSLCFSSAGYGPPGADHVYGFVYMRQLPKDVLGFCIWGRGLLLDAASLGYGERPVHREAPVAGAEAFFSTLLDAVAREPEALVINSVAGGGLDIIHNVLYRTVKQSGVSVDI